MNSIQDRSFLPNNFLRHRRAVPRASFIKRVYDTLGAEQILFGTDYPHGRAGRDDQLYPLTSRAMNELDVPQADKVVR